MANVRSKEKEEFWRLVMREFAAFEGTARAFCRNEGITENSFYMWRRELARRDLEDAPNDRAELPPLVPVKVVEAAPTPSQLPSKPIEIQTPGGTTLRVPEAIPKAYLSELVSALLMAESDVPTC